MKVNIPPHPSTRKNGKPKQRTATIVETEKRLPGYVLVEKSDRVGQWWIKEELCKPID